MKLIAFIRLFLQYGLSVLSVEPYGMKLVTRLQVYNFVELSVLSVEPYGMKPPTFVAASRTRFSFSALGRAVWDETRLRSSLNPSG